MTIDRPELKRLREMAGLSQRQLAKEAGISHSEVAYIENGERNPREGTVKKLADALNAFMEDILLQDNG